MFCRRKRGGTPASRGFLLEKNKKIEERKKGVVLKEEGEVPLLVVSKEERVIHLEVER